MSRDRGFRTSHTITWRGIPCVIPQRDFICKGWSQLEVNVLDPAKPPLPVTETGHSAQHCDEDDIAREGGAEAFVIRLLDTQATSPAYARYVARWQQLRMF